MSKTCNLGSCRSHCEECSKNREDREKHMAPRGRRRTDPEPTPTLRWYTIRCSNKAHTGRFMVLMTRPPVSGSCLDCPKGTKLVVE